MRLSMHAGQMWNSGVETRTFDGCSATLGEG